MGISVIKDTKRVVATGNDLGAVAASYVPYTGAVSNVNLGAFSLTATGITNSSMTSGSVLFAGASGIMSQDNANFFWDDTNNRLGIGNNSPVASFLSIGAGTTAKSQINLATSTAPTAPLNGDIWYNGTGAAKTGFTYYSLDAGSQADHSNFGNGTNTIAFFMNNSTGSSGQIYIYSKAASCLNFATNAAAVSSYQIANTGQQTWTATINTSGALSPFQWVNANHTNQTASTEATQFKFTVGTLQYATGALTTNRAFRIGQQTVAFVGASTLTTAANFSIDGAIIAGTNATITTSYGLLVQSTTSVTANVTTGFGAYFNAPTGATNNYAFGYSAGTGNMIFGEYSAGRAAIWINQAAPAAGNFALSASGTTTTFVNGSSNVSILINGSINVAFTSLLATYGSGQASYNMSFPSTAGTKLGITTSEKIGFWNTTPIVQPTTAVAAATFVANTSGTINDSATFDGYTIGQVVKALRNEGLLA